MSVETDLPKPKRHGRKTYESNSLLRLKSLFDSVKCEI